MNGINRAGLVLITELTSLNQPEPDQNQGQQGFYPSFFLYILLECIIARRCEIGALNLMFRKIITRLFINEFQIYCFCCLSFDYTYTMSKVS